MVGAYAAALALASRGPAERQRSLSGWPFWRRVFYRTYVSVSDDRVLALAAGVVFYAILALFPAVAALVSSYALFAKPVTIADHLALIANMMPESAYSIVDEQVTRIVTRTTGNLSFAFFFGLALAVWSANAGVKAVIDALNMAYGVRERRGFIKLNLVSLAFTVGAILVLLLAMAAIVAVPVVLSYLPFGGLRETLLTWARWPALFVALLLGLAVLYRFGPNLDHARFRWISPGAVLAVSAWLIGSALFSWYLRSFANYDATYGSLGAAIGLMMWMWLSTIVVLLGAELNAEIDAARGITGQPDGERIGK